MSTIFVAPFKTLWRNLQRNSVTKSKLWRKIRHNFPSQITIVTENCDRYPSQFVTDIHHNLWRTVTIPSQFVTKSHQSVTNLWRSPSQLVMSVTKYPSVVEFLFQNCDGPSVTTSVTIVYCPSQFSSQMDCDRKKSITIFPSQLIVTDYFPSQIVTGPSQLHLWQMKLWRTVFRHNFKNFPSQFPSQIATFPVVYKRSTY